LLLPQRVGRGEKQKSTFVQALGILETTSHMSQSRTGRQKRMDLGNTRCPESELRGFPHSKGGGEKERLKGKVSRGPGKEYH